jgi:T5SS/PEP-CTERM-associated repeat protein
MCSLACGKYFKEGNSMARLSWNSVRFAVVFLAVTLLCVLSPAHAEVTASGDVYPYNPMSWSSGTTAYIGKTGTGTLDITAGNEVSSGTAYIGYESGSTGRVTVDGSGSSWASGSLYVGIHGNGTLNIINEAEVTARYTVLSVDSASGKIVFDNGTLTTGWFGGNFDELEGTGTINTHGLVSDANLVFDGVEDFSQTLTLNDRPGQNITVNLEADESDMMGAGYTGNGSMLISNGVVLRSTDGYIGIRLGSAGTVTVDGVGSSWITGGLYVGLNGGGTLNITHGATVRGGGYIGDESGSTGTVTVDGAGSSWISSGLIVGDGGNGTLNITAGATVSSNGSYIGQQSGSTGVVTVDGSGSIWTSVWGLEVGREGEGILNITHGGLASVGGLLTIDYDRDGDSFINMASGGMLALNGQADDSLASFFDLISGTDAIRFWDDSISDWANITEAEYGVDYTLEYLTEGDLTGYTLLTVTAVPELATMSLLGVGALALLRKRRR